MNSNENIILSSYKCILNKNPQNSYFSLSIFSKKSFYQETCSVEWPNCYLNLIEVKPFCPADLY